MSFGTTHAKLHAAMLKKTIAMQSGKNVGMKSRHTRAFIDAVFETA